MPRCTCGTRGSLDEVINHCLRAYEVLDGGHGVVLQPWQCGGCGLFYAPGEDPAVWETQLEDGRLTLPICAMCLGFGAPTPR